jgi:hypothetical protein
VWCFLYVKETTSTENYYYYYYYLLLLLLHWVSGSRGSSVSAVSDYRLDDQAIGVRSLRQGQRIFPLAPVSRPALRRTQPRVQWVPGFLSPGQTAAGAWRWPLYPT